MPNPISTFFLLLALFSLLLAFCFALTLLFHFKLDNKQPSERAPAPQNESAPKTKSSTSNSKIYYIQSYKPQKRKRAKSKKPTIALKGAVLTPEEFKKIKTPIKD